MLRLFCVLSVCLSVCLSDVNSAWAKFRREKYTSFVITEGVGDDGEPVETIEDNINTLKRRQEKERFQNFKKTYSLIEETNQNQKDFQADINDFADYSDTEWEVKLFGLNMTRRVVEEGMFAPVEAGVSSEEIPDTLDWVEKGKVTGIKFQGVCGSCWAFAATSVLESHYAIYGGNLKFMSEQQLLDCVYPNEDACEGGWYSDGWVAIRSRLSNELPTEKSYQYLGSTTSCIRERGDNALVAANVDYPQIVSVPYREHQRGPIYDEDLANAVALGPVAVAMRVINNFKVYKGGLYTEQNCRNGNPNHAVVVVGYTPERFKIRNSWGTSWGEKGYAWFDRRIQNQCWIAKWAEYPKLTNTGRADEKESTDPCKSMTCLNMGVCAPNKDKTSARCFCPVGFEGDNCEAKSCVDVVKRCPKSTSKKCKNRRYQTKCPVTCGSCYN
ncbi:hypothetical protein ACHWQZ_G012169 [Mnemiopsis leidyi]